MRGVPDKTASEVGALVQRIPAFPPVAIRVLDLLQEDNVPVDKLVELMRSDPAFSAELLRRANSPLFAFQSEVTSLRQALILLGFRRVRGLALTVATGMYLRKAGKIEDLRRFWRYSLACALLSEELARACGLPEDVAYTAGLLHDIGRLGLMVAHPEQYAQLMRHATEQLERGEPVDVAQLERDLFGADHYEVGRRLAEAWRLPSPLPEVAGRHSREAARQWNIVGVVRFGCQLAIALGFGILPSPYNPSVEALLEELPQPVRNRLPADLHLLEEGIRRKLSELDIESFAPPAPAVRPPGVFAPTEAGPPLERQAAVPLSKPEIDEDRRNPLRPPQMLVWLLVASLFAALLLVVLKFLPV
jgi:putative nucleotidyltransferase with HDIG domain